MPDFLEQLKRAQKAKQEGGQDSYARMRDSVKDTDVRASWRDGDRWSDYVTERYQEIRDDVTLSEAGRAQKEQEAYDRGVARASKGWEAARQRSFQLAKQYEQQSVPMPDGTTLYGSAITNAPELSAIQSEADRITRRLQSESLQAKTQESSKKSGRKVPKNPNDPGIREAGSHATDVLQDEYAEAMEDGGLEGRIKAHAVLRVARANGVDYHSVAENYLSDNHRGASAKAQQYENYAHNIPTTRHIQEPIVPQRRSGREVGTYGQRTKFMREGQGQVDPRRAGRKRPWK